MQDPRFDSSPLYDIYDITIQIRDRICGGQPKNKDLIRSWVEATTKFKDEKSEVLTQEHLDLVVSDVADKNWIGFPNDDQGLFLQSRQVKACIKQSASLLGITKKKIGSKQILAEGTEVKSMVGGDRIYLGVKEPSGTDESAIHVVTAQGPRTALRRMDYVEKPEVRFQIWVLKTDGNEKRHIGEEQLTDILKHAQENGLGASRSQGQGKFWVTEFKKVS